MRVARLFLYTLLPLFAGCPHFSHKEQTPPAPELRLQGELSARDGQLLLRPCGEQRRFVVTDGGNTGIARDADELMAGGRGALFVDLKGRFESSRQPDVDGQLNLSQLYRLERGGPACEDPDFEHLSLRATGSDPVWSVRIGDKGLLLERPNQAPQALPYLEEQLPGDRLNFTSEANGQHLELWVAPQSCVDGKSGARRHLSAELRLNGEVLRGCAYAGGKRDE